ncbi:hypothetical protein [Streptacidiphilus jiangxiensis]|uniref:Uncharacterized protein n=1 Tax=Streptacidiphilus jiangxiensis TaxID=235985 RepID=A0A1H7R033_STRJI|nr:hypothetical protein [Streptacidiphilus jiangxiensis]SEL53610.1 hypothetical protein SAMN05414137_109308 [Streptacidiphilus jiangxiensis]
MVDTINSLASRVHELLVANLTNPAASAADVAKGLHDVIARATALGPDAAWLVGAGHSGLAAVAFLHRQIDRALSHLDAAVTAGFNDCVALHASALRPLHEDPRFRAIYERIRITMADLDELTWIHQEMHHMSRDAARASTENIGRLDMGISRLPQAFIPTRVPNTPGVRIARIDLAATQTALQRAIMKAKISRAGGNASISAVSYNRNDSRARQDAWRADDLDSQRRQAATARAFVERPGVSTLVVPCPPLGSLVCPG